MEPFWSGVPDQVGLVAGDGIAGRTYYLVYFTGEKMMGHLTLRPPGICGGGPKYDAVARSTAIADIGERFPGRQDLVRQIEEQPHILWNGSL